MCITPGQGGNNNSICFSNALIKTWLLWLGGWRAVGISFSTSCSVAVNFNAMCRMTTYYQTWPMKNYRLSQCLRGARLPLGSTFTFLSCLCSLNLTGPCATQHFNIRESRHLRAEREEEEVEEEERKNFLPSLQNCMKVERVWKSCQSLTLRRRKLRRWQDSWCLEWAGYTRPLEDDTRIYSHDNKMRKAAVEEVAQILDHEILE